MKTFVIKITASFLVFSILVLGISTLQERFIKPKIIRVIEEYNFNNQSSYIIAFTDVNLSFPFLSIIKGLTIIDKKTNTPVICMSDIVSLVHPKIIFSRKVDLLFSYIKTIDINSTKNNENIKGSISFPDAEIKYLKISKIYGIKNLVQTPIMHSIGCLVSLRSDSNQLSIKGDFHDIVNEIDVNADIQIDSEYNCSIFSKIRKIPHTLINNPKYYYKHSPITVYDLTNTKITFNFNLLDPLKNSDLSIHSICKYNSIIQKENKMGAINASINIKDKKFFINEFTLQSKYTNHSINGSFDLNTEYDVRFSCSIYKNTQINNFNLELGENSKIIIKAFGNYHEGDIHSSITSNRIVYSHPSKNSVVFRNISLISDTKYDSKNIYSINNAISSCQEVDINGQVILSTNRDFDKLSIHSLSVNSLNSSINGKFKSLISNNRSLYPNGHISLQSHNLSELSGIFGKDIWGTINANINFVSSDYNFVNSYGKFQINGFKVNDISVEEVHGQFNADLVHKSNLYLHASSKYLVASDVQVQEAEMIYEKTGNKAAGYIYTGGFYKKPFNIYIDYMADIDSENICMSIQSLDILFGHINIHNKNNIILLYKDLSHIKLQNSLINIGDKGLLEVFGSLNNLDVDLSITGTNIPIDVPSKNMIYKYTGASDFQAHVSESLFTPKIIINSKTKFTNISNDNDITDIDWQFSFNKFDAIAKFDLRTNGVQTGIINFYMPASTILSKSLYRNSQGTAKIKYKGSIDSAAYSLFGVDIEGMLDTDLILNFDMKNNIFSSFGYLNITDGKISINNQGIYAENIHAQIETNESIINVKHLMAHDGAEGTINSHGQLSFNTNNNIEYFLYLSMHKFKIVNLPHLSSIMQGQALYSGNIHQGLITGNLNVIEMSASMDHPAAYMRPKLFKIQNNNLNDLSPKRESIIAHINKLPSVKLDLTIRTDNPAKFYGIGIDSYWDGEFKMLGTLQSPLLSGSLSLIDGSIYLGHRTFRFSSGQTVWENCEFDQYSLSALGDLDISGYKITTNLQVNNKKWDIIIYSTPYLSQHNITALLLFGKNISDIKNKTNLGYATSALWKIANGFYQGPLSSIVQNNISIDTPDYDPVLNDKDIGKIIVKLGLKYKQSVFSGLSYYCSESKYSPVFFLDTKIGKYLTMSGIFGKDLSGIGGGFELEF